MTTISAWLTRLATALAAALAQGAAAAGGGSDIPAAADRTGVAVPPPDADPLIGFFAIGVVINIIVALVFVAWFRREWRRTGGIRKRNDSS